MKTLVALLALCAMFVVAVQVKAAKSSSLSDIHKIYIAPMPNGLDQYIRAEIFHQLKHRIEIVSDKSAADAIMTGTETQKTGATRVIDRWTAMSDTASAAVSLVDQHGTVLWSSSAGDRSIWWGVLARGGNRKVASRIVKHLKKDLK